MNFILLTQLHLSWGVKKSSLILRLPVFNWLWLISVGNARGNSTHTHTHTALETPADQIKVSLLHTDFHRTQKLTSSKRMTIQNSPRVNPEMLTPHSINPFTVKFSTLNGQGKKDFFNINFNRQWEYLQKNTYHLLFHAYIGNFDFQVPFSQFLIVRTERQKTTQFNIWNKWTRNINSWHMLP